MGKIKTRCIALLIGLFFVSNCQVRNFGASIKSSDPVNVEQQQPTKSFISVFSQNAVPFAMTVAEKSRELKLKNAFEIEDFNFVVPNGEVWATESKNAFEKIFKENLAESFTSLCSSRTSKCTSEKNTVDTVIKFYKRMASLENKPLLYSDFLNNAGYLVAVGTYMESLSNFGKKDSIESVFEEFKANMKRRYLNKNNYMRPIVFSIGEYTLQEAMLAFSVQADVVGTAIFKQSADGVVADPMRFFAHDTEHAGLRSSGRRALEARVNSKNNPHVFANIDTFIGGNERMPFIQLQAADLQKQFETDFRFVKKLTENLRQDKSLSSVQRMAIEVSFFVLTNENSTCARGVKVTSQKSILEGLSEFEDAVKTKDGAKECVGNFEYYVRDYLKSDIQNKRMANPLNLFPKSELSKLNPQEYLAAMRWLKTNAEAVTDVENQN